MGPGARVVLRAVVYYAVLITATTLAWRYIPRATHELPASLDTLFGGGRSAAAKAAARDRGSAARSQSASVVPLKRLGDAPIPYAPPSSGLV